MNKSTSKLLKLRPDILQAALEGFFLQRNRIDESISSLRSLLRENSKTDPKAPEVRPKRKRSAASRRRMAAAQKKRWAEARQAAAQDEAAVGSPKRRLSEQGRQNIINATKKRWAEHRRRWREQKAGETAHTTQQHKAKKKRA